MLVQLVFAFQSEDADEDEDEEVTESTDEVILGPSESCRDKLTRLMGNTGGEGSLAWVLGCFTLSRRRLQFWAWAFHNYKADVYPTVKCRFFMCYIVNNF